MNALTAKDLHDRARVINSREENLSSLKQKAINLSADILSEATIQGADLSAARARLKPKDWMEWLGAHCPAIHHLLANRYMGLAEKLAKKPQLTATDSLQMMFSICEPVEKPAGEKAGTTYPPHQEGLWRFSKFAKFITGNPITKWPQPCVEKLRDDLTPIAKQLWPEKF